MNNIELSKQYYVSSRSITVKDFSGEPKEIFPLMAELPVGGFGGISMDYVTGMTKVHGAVHPILSRTVRAFQLDWLAAMWKRNGDG